MSLRDLIQGRQPSYEWADRELKDQTILRGHHCIEKAFKETLIRGPGDMVNHREGTRWVGDDNSQERARFIFMVVFEGGQSSFQDMAQIRELDEFKETRDSIKVEKGDLVIEFKSEVFEAHALTPEELAAQEDIPVEEVEPADAN